ncbi:acyl carrier protein [Streptomyces sp. B3I7]|jgi:acyl carrier protein|uniref:acyl carrier protein n=1 Tax=unclassified Streptomyces TaxID=2593676 RepID=UPI002784B754|nr:MULTISPECIES: acyl carrier protein [unclassified Streptomyces]MDQ0784867.1 acyl carrier protein [Streptomyces sp. B3I8]MDQ0808646.1 acyl carrier protein [Streptomyces sp. B3I7]
MAATWHDVREWILERNPDLTDLQPETDIIDSRIIDSLQFVELVLFIEDLRGTALESNDVSLDSFRTLKGIEQTFFQ